MHETSERFEEALKCYDEAIDLFGSDSLRQSFSGFIDVLLSSSEKIRLVFSDKTRYDCFQQQTRLGYKRRLLGVGH